MTEKLENKKLGIYIWSFYDVILILQLLPGLNRELQTSGSFRISSCQLSVR